MRHFLAVILFCFSVSASAQEVSFKVLGAQDQVLFESSENLRSESVGRFSHAVLEDALLAARISQYRGSVDGVLSLNGLGSALEVLSDTEMNAYGWCYRVNGAMSLLMANEFVLTGTELSIEWYYAYAHLDKDQWTSMCVPAEHVPVQE